MNVSYKCIQLWLRRVIRRRTLFKKIQVGVLMVVVMTISASAFLLFQKASAVGSSYYIDCNTGSNSNNGSQGSPWLNLSKFDGSGADEVNLVPGDRVYLMRGCTFSGTQIQADWDGTSTDRIVWDAYGTGALPIIKDAPISSYNTCNSATPQTCIPNQGSTVLLITGSYLTFQNLEFTLTPDTKLHNYTACPAQHVGNHFGVNFSGDASYNIVQNSKFSRFEAGVHFVNGSTAATSPRFNKVLRNTIIQNDAIHPNVEPNGSIIYIGAWGVNLKGFDNEIAYNYFENNSEICTRTSSSGDIYESNTIEIFAAKRNHIHHNVSVNERVFSEMGSAYVPAGQTRNTAFDSSDNVLAYNTVYSTLNGPRFATIHATNTNNSPTDNTQILNNTIYYTSAQSEAIVCMGCSTSKLILKNNIIYAQKKAIYVGSTSETMDEKNNIFWNAAGSSGGSQYFQNYTKDASSLFVNPQFVDAASQNFRLASGSPARDAGTNVSSLMVYDGTSYAGSDVNSVTVPQNGLYDIGSNEYPVPVASAYVSDTFTRTTASGWGSAETGGTYTGSTASNFSVNGSQGLFTSPSCNSTLFQNLPASLSLTHTDMLVKVKSDKATTSSSSDNQNIYFTARKQSVGTYEYRAVLQINNSAIKMWAGKLAGSNSLVTIGSTFTHGTLTHSPNTWYWWRTQIYGTNPTTIRTKVWQDGTTEPTSWQVSTTDSEANLQNAGQVGLKTFLPSNCSIAPVVTTFDDFTVSSMSAPTISPVYQKQANCSDDLVIGGSVNGDSYCASATLNDADNPDNLKLEVEVQPLSTAFTNIPTATGSAVTASGSAVTGNAVVSGLTVGQSYHWQARALDSIGQTSSWLSFGNNTETAADFSTVALPTVEFTTTSSTGTEANATRNIGLTLSHSVAQPVTVQYAVTGGTATGSGTDYTLAAGTATISANTTTANIPITIVHDGWDESDETIQITLTNPTNSTLGTNTVHTYTIIDDDTTGVTVAHTGGSTNITEGSATDTYTVVLTSRPTVNVTITPTPNGQQTVSPTTLTFTSGNWYTAQTITVTAVDDAVAEGNHTGTITHASSSSDPTYNGLTISSLTTNITDNDSPGISVTESSASTDVTEGGATDSYTVVLTTQPTSDVVVNVSTNSQLSLSAPSLTFTNSNWATPQTVTVTAANDSVAEGAHTATITHTSTSSDNNYNNSTISSVTANITDNDTAGVTVTETSGTAVTEAGATDSYTVVLTSQPTADVTIAVATNSADLSVNTTSLTFTSSNWSSAQTVTVTGVNDQIDEDSETPAITHSVTSGDSNYNGISANSVTVTVTDNDTAGITVTQTSGTTVVAEGGATDTYTIVLTTQPLSPVEILLSAAEVTLINDNEENPIIFTADNWNTAQTITVTAIDDTEVEGTQNDNIIHSVSSADAKYDDFTISDISVSITDNDNAGITLTESSSTTLITEGGATDTYTLVLTNAPSADVIITMTGDADVTTAPTSVTFTSSNWSTPQTITVTAVNDSIVEGSHTGTITHAVTSSDGNYDGMSLSSVVATITDNDTAGVTLTQSGGTTLVTEGGATDTYTVELNSQPSADVTVSLSGIQVSPSPTSLIFTSSNWSTPQTVTVTATDDNAFEGSHSGSVSHTATSADSNYNGISISNVSVTVTDNDTAGVTLSQTSGTTTVAEGGTTDTYTVVLTSQPSASVTVTPTPSQVTVSPTSVTFTTANWSTPQTITVTAVDDASVEGNHSGSITHAATSSDNNYNGISIASITPSITDNDSAGITQNVSAGTTLVTEGGATDSYTLVLNTQPSSDVVINAATNSQLSLNASSFTFTTVNWATPQTITVTAVNDSIAEGAHSATITHTVASSDNNYNGSSIADVGVSVTDNDTAGVTVTQSGGTTAATEGGATDTYTLVLTSQPTSSVTVAITGTSDVSTSPTSATFTTGDWSTPQTITVTATNDSIDEDSESSSVTHAATSSDNNYNGISVGAVSVTVTDNDTADIAITQSSGTTLVTEGGATDSYTVVLATQPTADVTVTLTGSNQVTLSASSLTFTSSNWSSAQTVTVTAVDDGLVEGTHPATITHSVASSDGKYSGMDVDSVSVTITDNDSANITLTQSGGTTAVTEGGATDSYVLVLTSQPSADVVITLDPATGLSLSSETITFTADNWSSAQTVTVTGTNDSEYSGDRTADITHTVSSEDDDYDLYSLSDVTVSVAEDDAPNIVIAETDGGTRVNEASGTDTYTIRLNGQPASNVVVSLSVSSSQITVSPANLTFTSANWDDAQTVTITGVNDSDKEGNQTVTLSYTTSSSDSNFNNLTTPTISVSVIDDDQLSISVNQSDGSTEVTEGVEAGDEYKVSISSEPSSDVVIELTVPDDLRVSSSKLTFTKANWMNEQGVKVTANDDNSIESEKTVKITHKVISDDGRYNGMGISDITVKVKDNDYAGIKNIGLETSKTIIEGGQSLQYQFALTSRPDQGVKVILKTNSQITTNTTIYRFSPDNWYTPQKVTVFALNDDTAEPVLAGTISYTIESDDSHYNNLTVDKVLLTVLDNDGDTQLDDLLNSPDTDVDAITEELIIAADFDSDGIVNEADLELLKANWLKTGEIGSPLLADINEDGIVDLSDIGLFARTWKMKH